MNDILDDLESEVLLFADDTCLFSSGEDPVITAKVINRDLEKNSAWATKWKVIFNAGKSKDLIFSQNKYLFNSPPLILDGKFISRVHQHKHLGLWFSSNLDWEKQVQNCCLKANGKLAVLRSVKFLDRATLDLLYKLTIRSVLEYCIVVYYHSLTEVQKFRLAQVQYRAARLCTGALYLTSKIKLEHDLSWESIPSRVDFLSLSIFHKIAHHLTRPLIKKCMPVLNCTVHNTRNPSHFKPFQHKSQYFLKTFFPYTTKIYNNLLPHLRNNHDMVDFKLQLKEKYQGKKVKIFCRGISKILNSLHTQLRLGRSFLAAHGFSIGINTSDLCLCWRPETTKHYFLECFLFQEERKILFDKLVQILPKFLSLTKSCQLETILFGINIKNEEPDPRNIPTVIAVQKFILDTKRFKSAEPRPTTPHPPHPIPP